MREYAAIVIFSFWFARYMSAPDFIRLIRFDSNMQLAMAE